MDFGIKYLFAATFVYEALLVYLRPRYLVTQWYILLGFGRRRPWYVLKYLIKDAIDYVEPRTSSGCQRSIEVPRSPVLHFVTDAHRFWDFGSLFLRRCGVLRACCCGSGNHMPSRRCGVFYAAAAVYYLWSTNPFWHLSPVRIYDTESADSTTSHVLSSRRAESHTRLSERMSTRGPRATL